MKRFYPFLLAVALMGVPVGLRAQQQDASKPKNSQPAQQMAQKPERGDTAPDTQVEEMPVTVHPSQSTTKKPVDTDPVMGVPPLPEGKTSMIGGNVASIDGIHNKMKVKIFGDGGKWDVAFDERTHFYRDGKETTFAQIKKGDRVYVDTMSDKRGIFARNVRVVTNSTPADARGQVDSVNNGVIRLRDDPKRPGKKVRHNWLLIKEIDDEAHRGSEGDALAREVTSVKTGRTLDEIAAKSRKVWNSNRSVKENVAANRKPVKKKPRRNR